MTALFLLVSVVSAVDVFALCGFRFNMCPVSS